MREAELQHYTKEDRQERKKISQSAREPGDKNPIKKYYQTKSSILYKMGKKMGLYECQIGLSFKKLINAFTTFRK